MNLRTEQKLAAEGWALMIYRPLITLAAMTAGFSAFPGRELFVAFSVLMFAYGVRAIGHSVAAEAELTRRSAWLDALTARFAASEFHQRALDGQHEGQGEYGMPEVWADARRAALDDIGRDKARQIAEDNLEGWSAKIMKPRTSLHLVGMVVSDIAVFALASLLASG